jgi:membrane protein
MVGVEFGSVAPGRHRSERLTVAMVSWLDRLQRRSRVAGFVIAVLYKYFDDQGGYLAALITYYAFLSLFPVLLLLITVLGVVLAGHPDIENQVLHSALSQFPVIGDQLKEPRGLSGGTAGIVIGILVALYGGTGVGQAVQNAMDTLWAVPRNERPDPIRGRLRSLILLCVLGSALLGAVVLSTLAHESVTLGLVGRAGVLFAALAINSGVCIIGFRVTTARKLSVRDVAPGAVAAAVVWQVLQSFGATYVTHVVKTASRTNSIFALVLGLLAFLYLTSVALIICAEINAVRVDRLYPRALLTPFTDNVSLTTGDRRAYEGQAKAQRAKGFQDIDVTFHPPGDPDHVDEAPRE